MNQSGLLGFDREECVAVACRDRIKSRKLDASH